MKTPFLSILNQYWGYTNFRPLQEEIIHSVVRGDDTIAILPTGGGKSICFQLPTMAQTGLCIVVSPLVALMQDQVQALKEKGIKATMIVSGMNIRQRDYAYGNAIHGEYKFLYVSPERLMNDTFLTRLQEMPVNLFAIDEAHCISQWGYDFRPAYLTIPKLRTYHPDVPFLALTATATPLVIDDIADKLSLTTPAIFKGSVVRENLSFQVRRASDKFPTLLNALKYVKGHSIVYSSSRKITNLLTSELENQSIAATKYHAGLSHTIRLTHQHEWINNQKRVMVATNAFGMGIDKADVRSVIHYHVPESLEAYYQEAGRAGRDGKNAFAILLQNEKDVNRLIDSKENRFPDIDVLKQVLIGLFHFLKINYGQGPGKPYGFSIFKFVKRFDLPMSLAYNAIDSLIRQGWIELSDPYFSQSRFQFKCTNKELYRFQVNTPKYEPLVKFLLRNYGGILDQTTKINEEAIAQYLAIPVEEIKQKLSYLHQSKLASYYPQIDLPLLNFLKERPKADYIEFNKEQHLFLRHRHQKRIDAMLAFIKADSRTCRMIFIQQYFGEKETKECGICDVCMRKRKAKEQADIHILEREILNLLREQPFSLTDLKNQLGKRTSVLLPVLKRLENEEKVNRKINVWRLNE